MRTEKKSHRSRMDPIVALVLIFAVLKVTGLISWSWLWVLSPIWITLLIFAAFFLPFWSVDESLKENGNFQFAALVPGKRQRTKTHIKEMLPHGIQTFWQ